MLVSLKALKQYVDIDNLSASEIANGLTFAGVEIEDVITLAKGTNLVIGEILECEKHPDSDHLHVLKVDLGPKFGVEQIVCGAPNARKGLKVIVARVGAVLPEITIKEGVIRGVSSNGMCCSLKELGVPSKYLNEKQLSGIEELDSSAPVGEENVLAYLGLDDEILDAKVLANRPDLLSIINFSREVAAIFNLKVKIPDYDYKEDFTTDFKVNSLTDKCSQFSLVEVKNITVKDSPKWMKDILMASGIRSINNVVDIGNFVMLMTGQPLHMYDVDKLNSKSLTARNDIETKFIALDEKEYEIKNGDIVIANIDKPMCLGGIMGANECAVDENSKNIAIESASFDSAAIRKTSLRLGLGSESSSRFIKGTNHFQYDFVLKFAVSLLKQLADGKHFSNIVTYQNEQFKENIILTSKERINNRLATSFSFEQIENVLSRLNFNIKNIDNNKMEVIVPSFRLDVEGDADLSEEVIRLLGYENVESKLMKFDTTVGSLSPIQTKINIIRDLLTAKGLNECLTYSLISKKEAMMFNEIFAKEQYSVLHPLTDIHEVMRTSICNSLLKCAEYNISRQNKDFALYEVSPVSTKKGVEHHLGIVLSGNYLSQGHLLTRPYDFYDIKGLFEAIMSICGIDSSRYKLERNENLVSELHPGRSAIIVVQGKKVGFMGEIHPSTYKEYNFGKNNIIALELNLDDSVNLKTSIAKMQNFSKFPSVSRDLALVLDKSIPVKDLIKTIKSSGKGLVSDAYVFDVYTGGNLNPNFKSVAISITYSALDHTLEEKEITNVENQIKYELNKVYKAVLRI